MKLYHGTSAKNLESILQNGLQPRGERTGNWEEFQSRTDLVYLTTAYSSYFAMNAIIFDAGEKCLVFEIETDRLEESNLLPDEDFIAQLVSRAENNPLNEIHNKIRDNLESFRLVADDTPIWQLSLALLATCSHRGVVPKSAFTRYCVFDWRQRPLISALASNEGPHFGSPHEQYRQLNLWMFGNRNKLPRYYPQKFIERVDNDQLKRYVKNPNWALEEKSRVGIEIINL